MMTTPSLYAPLAPRRASSCRTSLLALLLLLFPVLARAGEAPLPELGSAPEALIESWGPPKSEMASGRIRVLVYDGFRVKVVDNAIVAYEPLRDYATPSRPSPASSGASQAPRGRAPAAVEELRNQGQREDIAALLVRGQVTVVDFFADWCGPCKQMEPKLRQIAESDPQVFLRKVDIVDWKSPIAQQIGMEFIPYVAVFDGKGQLVGQPSSNLAEIQANIHKAKQASGT